MTLSYTYKIIKVDNVLGVMEIEFTSDKYGSIISCAATPYEDEDLLDVITSYSPIHHWLNSDRKKTKVAVNTSGILTYDNKIKNYEDIFDEEVFKEQTEKIMAAERENIKEIVLEILAEIQYK